MSVVGVATHNDAPGNSHQQRSIGGRMPLLTQVRWIDLEQNTATVGAVMLKAYSPVAHRERRHRRRRWSRWGTSPHR